MTLVIAPLTTTVMGSAPKRLSGTASGINTAINSTANVLAVAILGVVALNMFSAAVDRRMQDLNLPPQAVAQVEAETVNLANAEAPPDLSPTQRQQVNHLFDVSFVDAFRVVMYVCAGLVGAAAVVSYVMVEGKPSDPKRRRTVKRTAS